MPKKVEEQVETQVAPGDYFDAIASAMRSMGITNPRELPDLVVEDIRARFA